MNLLILTVFFVGLLAVPAQLGSPCPPASEIVPCKCAKDNQNTIMTCVYHDPAILKLAFKQISSKQLIVDFFNISSTRLTTIDTKFFLAMTVRSALLYGDRWSSIADDAFLGQEDTLQNLEIQESLLTSVPVKPLKVLNNLEYFAMVNSEVSAIPEKAFDSLNSAATLRALDLSRNYIRTIGAGAFSKLTNLRTLDLYSNKLRSLPAGILPALNRITAFDISDNFLDSIVGDIANFQKEATVNMFNNKIELISGPDMKTMISNKLIVNINGNPLKCTCSMAILAKTTEETISGICQYPSTLIGRTLKSLKSGDFIDCFLLYLLNLQDAGMKIE